MKRGHRGGEIQRAGLGRFKRASSAIKDWGWRIGFLIGAIAALVVLWMRRTMDESLSAEHLAAVKSGQDGSSGSMKALLTTYWRPLLWVFLVTAGGTIAFYTYSVNAPAIVKKAFGEDGATAATWVNLLALIFLMAIQPIGGLISDRVGRKPLLVFFGIGGVLYTWVLITYLPQTTSAVTAFLLTAVGYVILTGYTSVNAIVKAEVFPARVRALGVGLGYALANSIFGGTAPVIYQAFSTSGRTTLFIVYVTAVIAVSLVVYIFFMRNRAVTALDREQGDAWTPAAVPVR